MNIKAVFLFSVLFFAALMGLSQNAMAGSAVIGLARIDPALQASLNALPPDQPITVIVTLRDQAVLPGTLGQSSLENQQAVIETLQNQAVSSQASIIAALFDGQRKGLVNNVTPFWIFNGLAVTARGAVIQELAKRPDVISITPDAIDIIPVGSPSMTAPSANLTAINAQALWNMGFYGQGVVVASLDSGVDISHPELSARWRGGSNSWYDPFNQHPVIPTDLNGHGTWTMGVMVAGDASGVSLGVAPQAQWIAARIFNDNGTSSATAIHLAFQWVLDPDGNPGTADAPQVVNNSWAYGTPGCNLEFQNDLRSLRNAGILPVFAAGNYGPGSATSVSPANYPEAFAVGNIDNNGSLSASSSRGPSACGENTTIYPEIAAPGVNINTTDRSGLYTTVSGTSFSAPHAAGVLALLLNAFPGLSADSQAAALLNTAVDLGNPGPDNSFGYGRLDAQAAYNWLAAGNRATPVPTSTVVPTSTPSPTAVPTLTPTPLPTVTPTPTGIAKTIHVGDLDGSAVLSNRSWNANVTILVHDANEKPLPNVKILGLWSNGYVGSVICLTNASGICQVSKTGLKMNVTSVTFTISNMAASGMTYQPASNHDPDKDSNGTVLVISK